jgi:hypothetical protein
MFEYKKMKIKMFEYQTLKCKNIETWNVWILKIEMYEYWKLKTLNMNIKNWKLNCINTENKIKCLNKKIQNWNVWIKELKFEMFECWNFYIWNV